MFVEMPSLQVELNKTQVAAGAAAEQGTVKELKEMQTDEKAKNYSPICLFLFSNNVDFKHAKRNCRKPF